LCQWCGILLKHDNHHEPHNKSGKLGIHGILGNLIVFWNNQSRRNKILIGTAAFLLLLCLFYVIIMHQEYHVGNSTFRLPDPYRIVGGYTAYEVSKTELYSDKSLITIEILQFSTLAGSDEYVYDLFINPETMETRNGQIVIFNKKTH